MIDQLASSLKPIVEKISLHSHFITSSRASWSLFALLTINKKNYKQVIAMPSFICQSIIAAALLAKWDIKFLDINYDSGMVNYDDYLTAMKENVDAVLFVHLLGNQNKMGNLKEFCDKESILLIEDSAQFYSPKEMLNNDCGLADVRLISFGSTKLVDMNRGGLVLSDDKSLLSEIKFFQKRFNFKDESNLKFFIVQY